MDRDVPPITLLASELEQAFRSEGGSLSHGDLLAVIRLARSILPEAEGLLEAMDRRGINGLPDEVLLDIFKHFLHDYPSPFYLTRQSEAKVDTSHLLLLTHISRRWRAVVVEYSPFWTRIDDKHDGQLEAFLVRSGCAPLSLILSTGSEKLRRILNDCAPRLRRLDLVAQPGLDGLHRLLSIDVKSEALEAITISYCEGVEIPLIPLCRITLFNQHSLPIKALAIHRVSRWTPVNHFPQLTHLYLKFDIQRDVPQMGQILDVLANTPLLQLLHIFGLASSTYPAPSTPFIHLQFLRSLVVVFSTYEAAFLILTYLNQPHRIYIRLDRLFSTVDELPPLPPLPLISVIQELEIVAKGRVLRLVAEGAQGGLWVQGHTDILNDTTMDHWLSMVHTMLPLGQILSLHLSLADHVPILPSLLAHFTGLQELQVVSDVRYELLRGDRELSMTGSLYRVLARNQPLLCPTLHTLSVDIAAGIEGWEPVPDLQTAALAHMLAFRAEVNHPIRSMTVQPFAGWQRTDSPAVSNFAEQLIQLRDVYRVKRLHVLQPGPHIAPFTVRQCWEVEGMEDYWGLGDTDKPRYF